VNRVRARLRRLPIRIKLALIFSCAMAVVLTGTAVFLYLRFEDELDTSIDQALTSRAVAAAVLSQGATHAALVDELSREEGFGEIVSRDGRVLAATSDVGARMLIPRNLLARARTRETFFELKHLTGITKHARLVARPVQSGGPVVVAGTTLKDRERANESLVRALLIGTPLALLLASAVSYAFAAGAMHPVERMRSRAATISAAEHDARLPLPEARDEIRRLGETLNAMLERLQAAFSRERAFVADASHELRTPLAILKAELELAAREGRSRDELSAAVNSAAEEVERLNRLTEDLLVLARADEGCLPVRRQPVIVADLLNEVADDFRGAPAGERDLYVEATDGLTVDADPERLREAVTNLTDNAFRHGDGTVRLSGTRVNGAVELHVTDEGAGFPEDFLPGAFARFSRAEQARRRGGVGLGLAIVDAIAKAHGGTAHAANRTRGSDVWLSLPQG
jgi:two-component system, OmpR family, sensor kinase